MTDSGVQVNIPAGVVAPVGATPVGERLTSIETKLDIVLKDHGDRINDHEARLRTHQNLITDVQAVANKAVSPKMLWTGITGTIAASSGAIAAFEWLFRR